MKFEKTEVWGFEHAIRGMRNPMQSHKRSDSKFVKLKLGENDMSLMKGLIKAGNEHRKFLRQIMVAVDITAPLYWWKEFDTYKVGVTANSESTMHRLAKTPITMECFELADDAYSPLWNNLVNELEGLRVMYNETGKKNVWKSLIRALPEAWLQKRTVTLNYENLLSMYRQRKNHKLTEWSEDFIGWALSLPYFKELFVEEEKKSC